LEECQHRERGTELKGKGRGEVQGEIVLGEESRNDAISIQISYLKLVKRQWDLRTGRGEVAALPERRRHGLSGEPVPNESLISYMKRDWIQSV